MHMVWPIHPRTVKMIKQFGLRIPTSIQCVEPVGYLEFLQMEKNARLILTDSGGIQEEACILKIPCVTLRENTERPETLYVGSNMLAGTDPKKIVKCCKTMLEKQPIWNNPFGDGTSAKKIIDILTTSLGDLI